MSAESSARARALIYSAKDDLRSPERGQSVTWPFAHHTSAAVRLRPEGWSSLAATFKSSQASLLRYGCV